MQVDAPAGAVRFLLHAPHTNPYNTAGQVRSLQELTLTALQQRITSLRAHGTWTCMTVVCLCCPAPAWQN